MRYVQIYKRSKKKKRKTCRNCSARLMVHRKDTKSEFRTWAQIYLPLKENRRLSAKDGCVDLPKWQIEYSTFRERGVVTDLLLMFNVPCD